MTKTLTRCFHRGGAWGALAAAALGLGCRATEQPGGHRGDDRGAAGPGLPVVESPAGVARPPFRFTPEDERLLEETQRGAFLYLWNECSSKTGMVRDRSSEPVISIAGVGFQLSALPVGVERGWVSRDEARERALLILRSLEGNASNRHAGLFFHYLDPETAAPYRGAYEHTVSTIDSALLLAGMITAGSYFGGEVRRLADGMVEAADWRAFVLTEGDKPYELGYVSLGWQPERKHGDGPGLLPYVWADCGDEQRLVMFLAVSAPREEHRLEPALYYKLRRRLGDDGEGPMAWFPWSGALFASLFAHCWINYSAMRADNPEAFGVRHRARVDWWENGRRAAAMHKRKCAANALGLATLKSGAWGLSASDSPKGYSVPGLFPAPIDMDGAVPEFDYSTYQVKDDYGDGTVAPYAAGACMMFDPAAAVTALRLYRGLEDSGAPLVWRDPDASKRQYGFQDAFNLGKMWAAKDCVAIDQGPLLLAIENARTGLIWKVFASHPAVAAGMERLGWDVLRDGKTDQKR